VTPAIRLLAIDIDGTLLNSRFEFSAENQAALRRAHERRVEIALVTGRRHMFALPIAQQPGVPMWLISSNGAVTKSLAGELFHRDYLPQATAQRLCAHMGDFRRHMVVTFDREDRGALVLEGLDGFHGSIAGWMQKNADYIAHVAPIEQCLTCDPIQVMYCGSIEPMRAAMARLASPEIATDITVVRTEYPKRDLSIVDVLNQGCSKGTAVARWAEHRGFKAAEVMAIGDNYNDVEMLEFAGVPVIMGNACDELKQNGWHVAPSNDENGVAAAIGQWVG
jgi:Cof subfamily protein (haloacid dehalogenase superfamily)